MNMNWKRWKMGLAVATLGGLVDGAAVAFVDPQIAWKALGFLMVLWVSKGAGMWLKQHPVEEVSSDTELLRKAEMAAGKSNAGGSPNGIVTAFGMAFVACFFLSGCALLDKAATGVSAPVVTERVVTNTVPEIQVVTNFVTTTVQLPGQTNVVTNLVVQVVTNLVPVTRIETVSVTNWVEKPSIAQGVNIATNVAGFVPAPFGTAATAGLGIVSGLLALLVRRKNQQAGALTAANDSLTTQLQAVVKGVEQVTTVISPEVGIKVKGIIAETSKALGVADDLHATVQAATKV